MDYGVIFESGTGSRADKISGRKPAAENGSKDGSLADLKRGQLITGRVISVGEEVTLDFYGQKVTAPVNVLKNAIPGETKTFEVIKTSGSEIELKVLDGNTDKNRTFKAVRVKDSDWDTIMQRKEQAAKNAGKETEYRNAADKLDEISSKLTEKDCSLLEKEGFAVEDFTVNGLYEAISRIKSQQGEQKPETTVRGFDRDAVAARLKEENLPVTQDNLAKILKALDLSEKAANMDDKAMQYLILREAEPTIENIYKAIYSGTAQNQPLTEKEWDELKDQVKEVIRSAGYEINEDNLQTARWLLESKLPLTGETFTYKKELEDIRSIGKGTALDRILEGMKTGLSPLEVSLGSGTNTGEKIIADINSIQPEAVTEAVTNGIRLTIRNLVTIQESLADQGSFGSRDNEEAQAGADLRYEEIRARRQLEEIRLKMTLDAAAVLEKKGIKLETQELGKVVEALRELEDSYYTRYLKEADAEASEEALKVLKETTSSVGQLRYIPSYVLGSTLADRETQTIPGLLTQGNSLKAQLDKAGTAYETLMTVPNKEYGDSIKKAFANMDSLLSELKIENTEQNQRAVRILAYNHMEISEESISQVKAYDLQVSSMIKNLHPAVTVRMIKEGINPLEMPINELNRTIDRMKEEQGITSEEKFSTFLNKLEKESGISEQERKAYIGIYRLLYNVEKSDGAALGAVVKAGREVTLDNLLTAVQTGKKGSLDAVIDDEFGTLQTLNRKGESISQQLQPFTGKTADSSGRAFAGGASGNSSEAAFGDKPVSMDNSAANDNTASDDNSAAQDNTAKEITEYLDRILKQIKEEVTPNNLKELENSLTSAQHLLAQAGTAAGQVFTAAALPSQESIWEKVRNIPVEQLFELLQKAQTEEPEEEAAYAEKVQEIRELCKNSEQSIRFLNDYQVPSTPMNILIANHILSNGESPIKKFLKLQQENIVEKAENSLKETDDLSDKLIDRQSMQEAYEQLEKDAAASLEQAYSQEKIDSFKLAELKGVGQQLTFLSTLAKKEYYQIPIETGRGITNMNLTIIRGTQDTGKVSVTAWSESLGNIKAEFTLKDRSLKGFICSDSKTGLDRIRSNTDEIEAAAADSAVNLKQLDFGIQGRENDTYIYQNPGRQEDTATVKAETERTLYRIAKAVVLTVRSAENSGT